MSTNKTIDELSAGVPITDTDKFAVWQGAGPTASVNATNLATYLEAFFVTLDTSTAGQIALVNGANALTGDAGLSYDSGVLTIGYGAVVLDGDGATVERLAVGGISNLVGQFGYVCLADGYTITWDNGTDTGTITSGINASSAAPNAVLLVDSSGGAVNAADLGAVGAEIRTGYFGTSVVTPVIECTPVPLAELGSAVGVYKKAMISDGLTLGTWGSAAVDGGIVVKPVWSNGVAWLNG